MCFAPKRISAFVEKPLKVVVVDLSWLGGWLR
jgi:hypothetical protein